MHKFFMNSGLATRVAVIGVIGFRCGLGPRRLHIKSNGGCLGLSSCARVAGLIDYRISKAVEKAMKIACRLAQ